MLDEVANAKPLQDTYDPAEGEGQSAEHDDAKGVHRSIEIKVAYQLGDAVLGVQFASHYFCLEVLIPEAPIRLTRPLQR